MSFSQRQLVGARDQRRRFGEPATAFRGAFSPRPAPRTECARAAAALRLGALSLVAFATACVPSGSAPPYEGGSSSGQSGVAEAPGALTEVFTDDFERPPARAALRLQPNVGAEPAASGPSLLEAPDAQVLDSPLGPNWSIAAGSTAWRLEDGRLCGQGAQNRGVWLRKVLPVNARIEFDAITDSADGDLKAEVWGDGKGHATGTSYTNASSYLAILGGWKNTLHVLARKNEHGSDRKALRTDRDSDDPREHPVSVGQVYRFRIERSDGKTVRFAVNDTELLSYEDPQPLAGPGHAYLGFNNYWPHIKSCYDNVRITPL